MPIYDVICTDCEEIIEEWLKMDEDPQACVCGGIRNKMPGGYFKLVYDNKKDICSWGDDGYNESQYWKEVKKLRSEGHNVKGITED